MTPQDVYTKELKSYNNRGDAHTQFYYTLPYYKDADLCNWDRMRPYSGNIIKRYQYTLGKPVVIISEIE